MEGGGEVSTTTSYTLRTEGGDGELEGLTEAYNTWQSSKEEDSSDDEIDAAYDLIEQLLDFASIKVDSEEVEVCDECDEEAEIFWPKLVEPVQLCSSCAHNARRSGWEPGQ